MFFRSEEVKLVKAARKGRLGEVNRLLASGVSPNAVDQRGCSALMASLDGNSKLVVTATLLLAGADPNLRQSSNHITPLHVGVLRPGVAKILLEAGADPNARLRKDGPTSLMIAAAIGILESVELLLAYGADPSLISRGKTALSMAQQNAHTGGLSVPCVSYSVCAGHRKWTEHIGGRHQEIVDVLSKHL